jgi:hypothetical protein
MPDTKKALGERSVNILPAADTTGENEKKRKSDGNEDAINLDLIELPPYFESVSASLLFPLLASESRPRL